MGNPTNYSLELPKRCLQLLDELWPYAQSTRQAERPDLGPRTSTFLISMSMPIINLPIERIKQRQDGEHAHYANDRPINPAAATAIVETLQKRSLGEAPFFEAGVWRFVCYEEQPFPNISHGVPESVTAELDREETAKNAADMPCSKWSSILRNALAHGGIAYLNKQGRSTYGEPVKMYAFVSGMYDRNNKEHQKTLTAVNFLRISEDDYYKFLRQWVEWLEQTGIAHESEAA